MHAAFCSKSRRLSCAPSGWLSARPVCCASDLSKFFPGVGWFQILFADSGANSRTWRYLISDSDHHLTLHVLPGDAAHCPSLTVTQPKLLEAAVRGKPLPLGEQFLDPPAK